MCPRGRDVHGGTIGKFRRFRWKCAPVAVIFWPFRKNKCAPVVKPVCQTRKNVPPVPLAFENVPTWIAKRNVPPLSVELDVGTFARGSHVVTFHDNVPPWARRPRGHFPA